ncbi:MAG TPA: SDR family oxidoreductase [Hyphomicrobiales bacterium]|nr:SDR family oxidoreductase [Hyphomicrobiales bacterium]
MTAKSCIVFGGSRRIGRAVCLGLAAAGHAVAVNARASAEEAEITAEMIRAAGGEAMVALGDVTDAVACSAVVEETVKRFGRLDVVVNCAVKREHGGLLELDLEAWREALASVLDGAFLSTKYAAPHLARTGGTIILFAGSSAFIGARGPATATAKSGLVGFVRSAAKELGPMGVTINLLSPGRIEAPGDQEDYRARLSKNRPVDQIPLGRPGTPEEIADAVGALASGAFRYMTGQTIHVNGGFYMG